MNLHPAFEAEFSGIYGERWPHLKEALLQEVRHVAASNPEALQQEALAPQKRPAQPLERSSIHAPPLSEDGRTPYYLLDGASPFAVEALALQGSERVLDLCAAPGGKTLLIHWKLNQQGSLTANEFSRDRRFKLLRVLKAYLPADRLARVQVTGRDAATWCRREKESYDRILLDAPCSSERHVLKDAHALAAWTPARPKRLAQRQWSMLSSAFQVLAPGGLLVYSTCSIHPAENDGVVERLLKKYEGAFEYLRSDFEIGEPTTRGWIFLPDKTGYGPLYVCRILKAAP